MAPVTNKALSPNQAFQPTSKTFGNWRDVDEAEAYIVEAWGQGFMFGALLIMSCITVANMRRGVLLHKMILFELLLAMSHGTFCFMSFDGYGWYLSATASLLYCSYFTHNIVAWMKIRPFFQGSYPSFRPKVCRWITYTYLTTLAMSAPVLIYEIFNNFRYFNNISRMYERVRPYESLMRDPWWIFSCVVFLHIIRKCYSLNSFKLARVSPRFGILMLAIFLAMAFTAVDVVSSIVPGLSVTDGINPYWKLALVFKCLTDNIMLDDFKSVLQRLGGIKLDGTTTMQENSMNLETTKSEQMSEHDHAGDEAGPMRNTPRRQRLSMSGRLLSENEVLDDEGRSRRRQSMAASAVSSVGVKVRKLRGLPFMQDSAQREARQNMERNRAATQTGEPLGHLESDRSRESNSWREPWDQLNFNTTPTDLGTDDTARRHDL